MVCKKLHWFQGLTLKVENLPEMVFFSKVGKQGTSWSLLVSEKSEQVRGKTGAAGDIQAGRCHLEKRQKRKMGGKGGKRRGRIEGDSLQEQPRKLKRTFLSCITCLKISQPHIADLLQKLFKS